MDIYKDFLRNEQNHIIYHQIQYLEKRQDEISHKLKLSMENHVLKISDDIKNIGFPNTNLAMEFLTESQNNLQKKLLEIEFSDHFEYIWYRNPKPTIVDDVTYHVQVFSRKRI